jgi:hypothetical protein
LASSSYLPEGVSAQNSIANCLKGALEPAEKELAELKIRHKEAMSFFSDIDDNKNNDDAIIEKFEPVNVRDDF